MIDGMGLSEWCEPDLLLKIGVWVVVVVISDLHGSEYYLSIHSGHPSKGLVSMTQSSLRLTVPFAVPLSTVSYSTLLFISCSKPTASISSFNWKSPSPPREDEK